MLRFCNHTIGESMTHRSSLFFCKSHSIYIQHSIPQTPEQNDFAEWLNHALCESVSAMLKSTNLPNSLLLQQLTSTIFFKHLLQGTSFCTNTGMDRNWVCHISMYLAVCHMFPFLRSCTKSLR